MSGEVVTDRKGVSPIIVALIAGLFTVVSAAVSAYITKEGIPWLTSSDVEIIPIHGSGSDIQLSTIRGDFASDDPITYKFNTGSLRIDDGIVRLTSDIDSKTSNGEKYSGTLTGEGKIDKGTVVITYEGDIPSRKLHWNGVMVLTIPQFGDLKGYWLTEHAFHRGKFAFGEVVLKRK